MLLLWDHFNRGSKILIFVLAIFYDKICIVMAVPKDVSLWSRWTIKMILNQLNYSAIPYILFFKYLSIGIRMVNFYIHFPSAEHIQLRTFENEEFEIRSCVYAVVSCLCWAVSLTLFLLFIQKTKSFILITFQKVGTHGKLSEQVKISFHLI